MLETIAETRMESKLSLIALGANLSSSAGSRAETIRFALRLIAAEPGLSLRAVSRLYATPAFPAGSGPDYVNACAALETALAPDALLDRLHAIEAGLGRRRDGSRWGARVVDLDLLAVGDAVLPDAATQDEWRALPPGRQTVETPDRLILPHPRLQDRAFVLVPLCDIAPLWRHPRTGRSAAEMLAALPAGDRESVRLSLDNPAATDHIRPSPLI